MSFMKDFDHLKIQMKDIASATNNFDSTKVIGRGGFGKVYKGELSSRKGLITAAFKQLDRRLGQGNIEFWKKVMMLSRYKHENLISLMHFCTEGDEMILVYEYACRGSLDRYLSDANTLTWIQRLKICVGVARGLCFLHDPKETHQRVIHRDIKSANILLDEKWTAKVSDFGLSKVGPANQVHTYLVSYGVGTMGYCDPLYLEMGFLSKESDVYSFGVVMFEVLCGRLCTEYHKGELPKILVPEWRRCYDKKRLDEIILAGMKEQMDPGSLKSFSAIAYQCVKKVREERPMMAEIVKKLEFSLRQQENPKNRRNSVDFIKDYSQPAPIYKFKNYLKGFYLGSGSSDADTLYKAESVPYNFDVGPAVWYNFDTVKAATSNFSKENKAGSGGLGTVYKGTLEDGKPIAVKRLSWDSQQGGPEFENEVRLVAKLQHRNLVKLVGFSIEDTERLLIYEFISNGSLDQILFDATKRELLDWEKRYNIIKGIANGLLYLHEDSPLKVIHRDMKANNVLLDAKLNPKITNFGITKLFKTEQIQGQASRLIGTHGYMAPEYSQFRRISVKVDVFSFGVLVLEIVTGQSIEKFQSGETVEYLLHCAWKSLKNDTTSNLIDPTMKTGPGSLHEINRSIHIGLLCVQENENLRPTMNLVVQMLNNFSTPLPVPAEPAFLKQDNVDPKMPPVQEPNPFNGEEHSSSSGNSNSGKPKISKSQSSLS